MPGAVKATAFPVCRFVLTATEITDSEAYHMATAYAGVSAITPANRRTSRWSERAPGLGLFRHWSLLSERVAQLLRYPVSGYHSVFPV